MPDYAIRKGSKWRGPKTSPWLMPDAAEVTVSAATENGVHFYWPDGRSEVFGIDSFLECFEPVEEAPDDR